MSGARTSAQQTHRMRLQRASAVAFWVACAVIAVSKWTTHVGHSGLLWTIVEDCGVVVGALALLGLAYGYWRGRREGRTLRRMLPNESQISRFLASRRKSSR
jgi:predicted Na+-dependent transporter